MPSEGRCIRRTEKMDIVLIAGVIVVTAAAVIAFFAGSKDDKDNEYTDRSDKDE